MDLNRQKQCVKDLPNTYRKLVVEITKAAKDANKETLVRAERVNSDLLAHLKELVTENGVARDLLLMLDCESFETSLELSKLLRHVLQLLLFNFAPECSLLLCHGFLGFKASDTASHYIFLLFL